MNPKIKIWYNQIGFHNNPFSIKANKYDHRVLGNEEKIKEILQKIGNGSVIYVCGEYGTGKTTLLKRIVQEFGGYRNIFYHSCNSGEKLDMPDLLRGKYRLLGRLLDIKARGMILLLDEAQCLTLEEEQEILKYYSQKYVKSVIFVGKDEEVKFMKETRHLIADNVYSFGMITDENAIALIRRRIGNIPLLSDDAIKEINRRSKRNPRFLLENCEDICRKAIGSGLRRITDNDVREFLSSKNVYN